MKRVLYILQGIGIGGVSSVILNYYSLLSDSLAADFVVTVPYNYIPQDVRFELESKGCTIYHVTPFTKNMVKYRNDVKHIIKNGNYDIIHDNTKYFCFLSLGVAKKNGVPIRICHVHNTVSLSDKSFLHRAFIRFSSKLSIRSATLLFACSKQAGQSMFGNNEYHVIFNAIDVDKYKYNEQLRKKVRKELGINDSFVLIMTARSDIIKRYDHAFRVFEQICLQKKESVFLAVGIDKNNCISRDLAVYNSLPVYVKNRILQLGKRNDVNALLNAADVCILTSEHEGLGISIIEAQANGLPCFVSSGVPNEVNITNLVHFLPCLGDPNKWANEICNFVLDEEREKYAQAVIESDYSINSAVIKLKRLYGMIE